MSDRELLEWAAKAAGYEVTWKMGRCKGGEFCGAFIAEKVDAWNPLTDDGDALRLAVKLRLPIEHFSVTSYGSDRVSAAIGMKPELYGDDPYAATRRAIVRSAASIGQHKGE